MKLFKLLNTFKADEDGAVTVDWVVLTAGIVGLAVVIGSTVADGVSGAAEQIGTDIGTNSTEWTTSGGTGTN